MDDSTITLSVDSETARIYHNATEDEQRKLQWLLSQRLRELTTRPMRPLNEIMDEIGTQAEARGMTPEILDSILREQ